MKKFLKGYHLVKNKNLKNSGHKLEGRSDNESWSIDRVL